MWILRSRGRAGRAASLGRERPGQLQDPKHSREKRKRRLEIRGSGTRGISRRESTTGPPGRADSPKCWTFRGGLPRFPDILARLEIILDRLRLAHYVFWRSSKPIKLVVDCSEVVRAGVQFRLICGIYRIGCRASDQRGSLACKHDSMEIWMPIKISRPSKKDLTMVDWITKVSLRTAKTI